MYMEVYMLQVTGQDNIQHMWEDGINLDYIAIICVHSAGACSLEDYEIYMVLSLHVWMLFSIESANTNAC